MQVYLPPDPELPPPQDPARRSARRRRLVAWPVSLFAHVLAVSALVWTHHAPPAVPDSTPMTATLVDGPSLEPAPAPVPAPPAPAPPAPTPPAPAKASPAKPASPRSSIRPTPTPRAPARLAAREKPEAEEPIPQLSEADLAGAAAVEAGEAGGGGGGGAGGGGGSCNMARLLQNALRKDGLVQTAVAGAHDSRAMMVWNGDWVRSTGEDGKGLAAVREAILWEVGFAPAACRSQPVHGLVMLSLRDGPGAPKLVVGSGVWRWSDLLTPKKFSEAEG